MTASCREVLVRREKLGNGSEIEISRTLVRIRNSVRWFGSVTVSEVSIEGPRKMRA